MSSSPAPSRVPDRRELWAQLGNAIELRSAQDQVVWAIFGIFWAANALLLVALFNNGSTPHDPLAGRVVGAVGIALSVVWFLIQRRALGHLVRHEKLMAKIEVALGISPDFAVSADVNRAAFKEYVRPGPRARHVMPACSVLGALGWTALLIWALVGHP